MPNRRKVIALFIVVPLIVWSLCFAAVLGYRGYLEWTEEFPVKYPKLPFPVEQGVYSPGDTVRMEAVYCPMRTTRYNIVQRIENTETGQPYPMPKIASFIEESPCKTVHIEKVIPLEVPSGEYRFCFTAYADGIYKPIVGMSYCSTSFPVL